MLDLTDVTLLDASALAVVVEATRSYAGVELRNPSAHPHRVLAVTHLDGVAVITG